MKRNIKRKYKIRYIINKNKENKEKEIEIIKPECKRIKIINILKNNLTKDKVKYINNSIINIYFIDLIKNTILIINKNLIKYENNFDKLKYLIKELKYIKTQEYYYNIKENLKLNIKLLLENKYNNHIEYIDKDINEIINYILKNNYKDYIIYIINIIDNYIDKIIN